MFLPAGSEEETGWVPRLGFSFTSVPPHTSRSGRLYPRPDRVLRTCRAAVSVTSPPTERRSRPLGHGSASPPNRVCGSVTSRSEQTTDGWIFTASRDLTVRRTVTRASPAKGNKGLVCCCVNIPLPYAVSGESTRANLLCINLSLPACVVRRTLITSLFSSSVLMFCSSVGHTRPVASQTFRSRP